MAAGWGQLRRRLRPGGQFSAGAGLLSSLRASFGRSVVPHSPASAAGGVLLPLALRGGLCWFRGRGFCSPNDRRLGAAVGSSDPARRAGGAVPG